jgi:peptide-methionine (S)-S-oxide reductase
METGGEVKMRLAIYAVGIFLLLGLMVWAGGAVAGEGVSGSAPERGETEMEKATFAAGCFWGVEATFRGVKGVVDTQVGYTGGKAEDPTYRQVCSDRTGHAEAIEITYDPAQVSYDELLKVFWELHDPTQLDRQGPDVGSQYRSAIFFHSSEQEAAARASKAELEKSGKYKRPIVTQIVPAAQFYRAEEYHQQYLEKLGSKSCGSH